MIEQSVLGLQEVDEMQVAVVGGKGAHLGGLSRIDGIRVPAGFCVTTDAFRRIMAEAPSIDGASAMIRRKASVVTQKPAGTRMPSIRESSPSCAPLPPTTATCVWSISWKPNT
jgi:phosphoenolpyruvate synthase/pyruvate phosphate dikinase